MTEVPRNRLGSKNRFPSKVPKNEEQVPKKRLPRTGFQARFPKNRFPITGSHKKFPKIWLLGIILFGFILNMFAQTRTLLHTFNRHDHHHHHHHHHHHPHYHHHHIMIIISLKCATPSEQHVDWGNSINFIFMRVRNSPPPLNNMLIGVITSTLSS